MTAAAAAPRSRPATPARRRRVIAGAFTLVSEDVYLLLVQDCAWTVDRFRTWLIDTVAAALT